MSWSPDGKRLAFSDPDPGSGFRSIFELSVGSGERRKLTSGLSNFGDLSPAYSPDGKFLAFVRWLASGVYAVFVIPAAGGDPRQLTSFDESARTFDWTQDGRGIIYEANKNGSSALWRVPVFGGTPRRIADAGFDVFTPVIARSGNRMAFVHYRYTENLWRLDLDRPSEPRKLAATSRMQSSPQYSPDGTMLVFRSNRSGGWPEVWTADSEGRNLAMLTSMGEQGTFAGTPRWSPDGLEIAFDARPKGNPDIYVVRALGGLPRRITSDPAEDVLPSFSHDGRYIYFSSNRSGRFEIWKVSHAGGDAEQVTRQGGVAGLESADGKYIYYMSYRHSNELWRVPTAGGPEEMIFDGAQVWKANTWRVFWGLWTVGPGAIIYIDRDSSAPKPVWQIKRFDLKSRFVATLATIPREPVFSDPAITVSPDGRSLVYTQFEESSEASWCSKTSASGSPQIHPPKSDGFFRVNMEGHGPAVDPPPTRTRRSEITTRGARPHGHWPPWSAPQSASGLAWLGRKRPPSYAFFPRVTAAFRDRSTIQFGRAGVAAARGFGLASNFCR
jgi:Tol biopolymer transport system component